MKTTKGEELLFRNETPTKREVPYEKEKEYQSYRAFLKEDFKDRCGYCNSHFGIVKKDFHIDHFIPKRVFKKYETHTHLLNDYKNLIYACPSCNGSKSGKWPSEDPDIAICKKGGFIDPCSDEYDTLFYRNNHGEIYFRNSNKTASYMYKELKLFLQRHQYAWKIEKLMQLIKNQDENSSHDTEKDRLVRELIQYLEKHFEMDYTNAK